MLNTSREVFQMKMTRYNLYALLVLHLLLMLIYFLIYFLLSAYCNLVHSDNSLFRLIRCFCMCQWWQFRIRNIWSWSLTLFLIKIKQNMHSGIYLYIIAMTLGYVCVWRQQIMVQCLFSSFPNFCLFALGSSFVPFCFHIQFFFTFWSMLHM